MFEAVHVRPEGQSTVSRMAITAGAHGYDGIVVRNHDDATTDDALPAEVGDVRVVRGIEVRSDDPDVTRGVVGNERSTRTIIAVHGGTTELNELAVSMPAVDVLAHPMRGSGDLNHVMVKEAAANGVRLEASLTAILRRDGGYRVRAIQGLRKLKELVDHYDAPYVVSADPHSHLEVRSPRDLAALGASIGVGSEWTTAGLEEWGHLVARNRCVESADYIEPGVRRGEEP